MASPLLLLPPLKNIFFAASLREGIKKLDFMSPIRGCRVSTPFQLKKSNLFSQNVKNTQQFSGRASEKLDFLGDMSPIRREVDKTHFYIFLYCHPCLSTSSKEIFIKKGDFFPLKKLRGRGGGRVRP